ncbi:MAG: hypothetical protein A2151_00515 [Candidatus Muproteobacteria bacterium RBG_16_65_34]|uniref:Aromatic hydrocarbon degradation protein n=1 Tax=Candidatus Muproteobacteria bacterium RBG_16_65_34 TaxID=1817760 RepID=A0A1F6TKR4_9PROT|nr:MAG: hypothetical protein A2151_00515 [Candidatus Muproteobacteria bacterium RBG_16_65_34]
MSSSKKNLTLAVAVAAAVAAPSVFATNGMNMQGYGPIAYGMGGASMAYDNGTAATMNNPATLGLMGAGNRLDVALGVLMPDVSAETGGMKATSGGDQYLMPAVGYAHKEGALTYGFGIFAQGGMGTEYAADTFMAMGSGQDVRSELGVGRLIFPIAYNVDSNLTVGGSIDYVWATLDLKMAATGPQFAGLVTSCSGGTAVTGCAALGGLAAAPWARIDFSGGGDFSGAATGTGFAGKLGAVYKFSNELSVGATYHSKTSLSDLETGSSDASLSAPSGTLGTGKIKVRDFEWPATYAIGVAWNASKELMVAADIKRIEWKDVMKDFKMTYEGALAGASDVVLDASLPQNWENQTVTQIGVAYKMSDPLTLRAGINHASSQIPDQYVNPLFPAIMETHYTVGLGYAFDKASAFNAGIAVAPQVTATDANGVTSKSGGTSFQLMYTSQF